MQLNDYLTISELCEQAGFSRQWLYYLWDHGKGPLRCTRRIGGQNRILIPVESSIAFLAKRQFLKSRKTTTTAKSAVESSPNHV